MDFTVGGQKVRLTREQVERKLKNVSPEGIRVHAVEVNGVLYPVKQALEEVVGLDRADFTSHAARRIFRSLNLPVSRAS